MRGIFWCRMQDHADSRPVSLNLWPPLARAGPGHTAAKEEHPNMSTAYLPAEDLRMAEDEILTMVDEKALDAIREFDPSPLFKAFLVAKEGLGVAKILGEGGRVLTLGSRVVRQVSERMPVGQKVFHGHESDIHERVPIGEIVGKRMDETSGERSVIAAVYIQPPHHDVPTHVASLESELFFNEKGEVLTVQKVNCISIGSDQDRFTSSKGSK